MTHLVRIVVIVGYIGVEVLVAACDWFGQYLQERPITKYSQGDTDVEGPLRDLVSATLTRRLIPCPHLINAFPTIFTSDTALESPSIYPPPPPQLYTTLFVKSFTPFTFGFRVLLSA